MKRKKPNTPGLKSGNFRKSSAWRVDQDYGHKLSDADQQWLSTFLEGYYGGTFKVDSMFTDQEERKELWREHQRGRKDVANFAFHAEPLETFTEEDRVYVTEPAFTSEPAYRELHGTIGRLARAIVDAPKGTDTTALKAEHKAAVKALEAMNRAGQRGLRE